jgi:hypothetical protein
LSQEESAEVMLKKVRVDFQSRKKRFCGFFPEKIYSNAENDSRSLKRFK